MCETFVVLFLALSTLVSHGASKDPVGITGSKCLPPNVTRCSVDLRVLTVPEKARLRLWCQVKPSGDLLLKANWTRKGGHLDSNRTTIESRSHDSVWNVSLEIRNISTIDEGVYILKASDYCGEEVYRVQVLVQEGGCTHYQTPNATNIVVNSTSITHGSSFRLTCFFNGDTNQSHYSVVWSKDSVRNIVKHGPPRKYETGRRSGCPSKEPCCSFYDHLVVREAIDSDSGTYSCSAVSANLSNQTGSALQIHIQVDSGSSDGELTELAVGVLCGGGLLFLSVFSILCYLSCSRIRKRKKKKKRKFSLLINEDNTSSYGSASLSSHRVIACPPSHANSDVFILYGLELERFHSIRKVDSPAHTLIMDFVKFLEALKIPCGHDGYEHTAMGRRDFSARIGRRVQGAKAVIVVCSQVLHTAFWKATASTMVQMKFGRFNAQGILRCITACPSKFLPVSLAGQPPVARGLEVQRRFNVEGFAALVHTEKRENLEEALKTPKNSELYCFVQELRQLLC